MTDKELILKKTARRRLVGAITLVILLLLILPFVLKDRVADLAHEEVKVTVINEEAPELLESAPINNTADTPENTDTAAPNPVTEPTATAVQPEKTTTPSTTSNTNDTSAKPANESQKTPSVAPQTIVTQNKQVTPLPAKNVSDAAKPVVPTVAQAATATNPAANASPEATVSKPASSNPSSNQAVETTPPVATKPNAVTDQLNTPSKNQAPRKLPTKPGDLSKTNADVAKKTTNIGETPPDKKPATPDKKVTTKKSGAYFVQFGVFSERKNLDSLRQKLAQNGIESVVEPVGDHKFKLRSQPYSQRSDAQTAQQQMQAMGVNGIVVGK